MKNILLLICGLAFSLTVSAQSCLPQGITFTHQQEIDNFPLNYPGCSKIEGNVTISGIDITNLNGLSALKSIGGGLSVYYCALVDMTGLDSLSEIGGGLIAQGNDYLHSLAGLEGLKKLTGGIWFRENNSLATLNALSNLASFTGALWIYTNDSLSECAVKFICDYLNSPTGFPQIYNNAVGCNSPGEVDSICSVISGGDIHERMVFSVYPNPASGAVTIETGSAQDRYQVSISDLNGREIISRILTEQKSRISLGNMPPGVYVVRIITGESVETVKLVRK